MILHPNILGIIKRANPDIMRAVQAQARLLDVSQADYLIHTLTRDLDIQDDILSAYVERVYIEMDAALTKAVEETFIKNGITPEDMQKAKTDMLGEPYMWAKHFDKKVLE